MHQKPKLLIVSLLVCCLFPLNSCVWLKFSFNKTKSARGVHFTPPPAPYHTVHKQNWDVFWVHPKNQNVISFFSNCSPTVAFTSLWQLKKELLNDLKNFTVKLKQKQNHQKQTAYYLKLKENPTRHTAPANTLSMEMLIFKKQNCFYVLSLLINKKKTLPQAHKIFQQFIKGFQAP